VAFLARIASIIPPPRYPLTRLAGVFAPNSPWRAAVVAHERAPSDRGRAPESATPAASRTALASGVAKPVGQRIDWASLIRRTYLEDVLACPCGGRRYILADITEPEVVLAILQHLGLPTEPPPVARARSPDSEAA